MAVERPVKLKRSMIVPLVADHWAVQVGDTWYEVAGKSEDDMHINKSYGDKAESGSRAFGSEIVGVTTKTDEEIKKWIDMWVLQHVTCVLIRRNCQKFAFELIWWLTDGVFKVRTSEMNQTTSIADIMSCFSDNPGSLSVSHEGNVIKSQKVAGPGLGAFADAKLYENSVDFGKVAGFHFGLNVSTGIGVRNGNAEVHLLGFGGKVGKDGVEINTPILGVRACSIM